MESDDLNLDALDTALQDFEEVTVEGGVDAEADDASCPGGACKI